MIVTRRGVQMASTPFAEIINNLIFPSKREKMGGREEGRRFRVKLEEEK